MFSLLRHIRKSLDRSLGLRLPKVSLTLRNTEERIPAEGGPASVGSQGAGGVGALPGRPGQQLPDRRHYRHQGRAAPLREDQHWDPFLFLLKTGLGKLLQKKAERAGWVPQNSNKR